MNPADFTAAPAGAPPVPGVARIGRWIVSAVPQGWAWIPGFGIQKQGGTGIPSNVCLKEDELLAGNQLALYIRAQITLMKRTFLDPQIAGPAPLEVPDATEAALLMIRHQPVNGATVFQVQHYIRSGRWIGIATLSTLDSELLKVRPDFDQFMKLLKFDPVPPPSGV